MPPLLRSTLHCQVRAATEPKIENCLDFLSSDATLDRYGEIISPAGWQLATYLRNPVFQNAHQYGDILFTLGKALITEVRGGDGLVPASAANSPLPSDGTGAAVDSPSLHHSTTPSPHASFLFQRIQFAVDANPMAKIAYALYSGGFLSAVSVGFIPLRWQDSPVTDNSPLPSDGRGAGAEGSPSLHHSTTPPAHPAAGEGPSLQHSTTPSPHSPRRIYLEQELLEVSAVAIPANPNALALAFKSGAVEKSDLQNTLDLLRQTLSAAKSPPHETPHPFPAVLPRLAHLLTQILKRP